TSESHTCFFMSVSSGFDRGELHVDDERSAGHACAASELELCRARRWRRRIGGRIDGGVDGGVDGRVDVGRRGVCRLLLDTSGAPSSSAPAVTSPRSTVSHASNTRSSALSYGTFHFV